MVLLLAPLVALAARPPGDEAHVVSLEDVTGTTARPAARPSLLLGQLVSSVGQQLVSSAGGATEVGYPEHGPPPRPHDGVVSLDDVLGPAGRPSAPPSRPSRPHGVVSLEDVTGPGHPGLVGHLPPPPPPQPGWPGADAYRSPCYPSYGVAPPPVSTSPTSVRQSSRSHVTHGT